MRGGRRAFARGARGGFTLVELLVVIGIIALPISVLIPALARDQVSRAKCLANLRQLTNAWMMYANDNRGQLVNAETYQPAPPHPQGVLLNRRRLPRAATPIPIPFPRTQRRGFARRAGRREKPETE